MRIGLAGGSRLFRVTGVVTCLLGSVAGCTTVAQVTSLDDPACRSTVRDQLNSVLIEQGEKPDIADGWP